MSEAPTSRAASDPARHAIVTPPAVAVAALLGAAWGLPIVTRLIADVDFPFHLETAEEFASTGRITMPHFLLQVLLGGMFASGLFGSLQQAGIVFFTALYAASAAAICWYVARRADGTMGAVLAIVAAMAVLMAGPIVPAGDEDLFMIGYFPPNVYHNPTMLVAKPLLVLTLMSAVAAVTRSGAPARGELAVLVLPVVLLGVAKPNYLGCLVPALAAAGAWTLLGGPRAVSWIRVGAVAGAAVLTLGATFVLYGLLEVGSGAGLTLAPLAVIGHYTDVDAATIAASLLASLAFPLATTVLWPVGVWRDPGMRLAWIGTAVGLFFSYFLAESGTRMYDGNFLWTGQMAVFVLFVAGAAFVVSQLLAAVAGHAGRMEAAATIGRALVTAGVLWLHVGAGIRHVQLKVEPSTWLAFWT